MANYIDKSTTKNYDQANKREKLPFGKPDDGGVVKLSANQESVAAYKYVKKQRGAQAD